MTLSFLSRRVGPRCHPLLRRHFHGASSKHERAFRTRWFSAQPQLSEEEDYFDQPFSPPIHFHHYGNEAHSRNIDHERNILKQPKIGRLVLVRHGQSEWNVTDPTRNLTARFTGWADIGLTQQGTDQALAAGHAIEMAVEKGLLPSRKGPPSHAGGNVPAIDVVFCSLLKRSEDTMNILLEEIHLASKMLSSSASKTPDETVQPKYMYPIPIIHSWRLNERHYGALVGLSKEGAERLYGKVRLNRWRDSWGVPPPPMPLDMVKRWGREDHCQPVTIVKKGDSGRTCVFDPTSVSTNGANGKDATDRRNDSRKSGIKIVEHGGKKRRKARVEPTDDDVATTDDGNDDDPVTFMPSSESLRDTYERFLPLWIQGIAPHLRAGRTVLVVGHANTIRSMLFAIDGDIVTKETSKKVKIPSALPLIYEFVDQDGSGCLEVVHDDTGEDTTRHSYRLGGRECSDIVPGNLRVLKPHVNAATKQSENYEVRHQLSGTWVETDETKSASFCTELGQKMGEHDIA